MLKIELFLRLPHHVRFNRDIIYLVDRSLDFLFSIAFRDRYAFSSENNKRYRDFTTIYVGSTDDACICSIRMIENASFKLRRSYLEAFDL